jgi:hypothetical protein
LASLLEAESREFLRANRINEPISWSPPLELISDLDLPDADPAKTNIDHLHDLAADMTLSITEIAECLNTSPHVVRYLLDEYPAEPSNASAVESVRTKMCPTMTADVLYELYVRKGRTLNQIAAEFGTNRHMVKRLLIRDGLPIRHRPPPPSGDWLYQQHVVGRRTLVEIAEEAGVQPSAVCTWKGRHHLASRVDESNRSRRPMSRRSAKAVLEPWFAADPPSAWLRRFVEALSYPTMQAAATELSINPATLRYQIRALERIFGAPLLFRARHGLALRPTALGEQVAQAVHAVIDPVTVM